MKRFIRIISVLAAAVMLVSLCAAPGASAAGSIEDAQQSVVLVAAGGGWGSGFTVGNAGEDPQYVVTNCHVISKNGVAHDDITVYFSAAANKYVSAEIIAVNTDKDICILELPEPTSERKPLSLCKSDNVSIGDEAYVLGYPSYSLAGKNYTTFDIKDITSTKGSISQKTRVNPTGAVGINVFMTDALIDGGNSGGPMVNANGEAIGIAFEKITTTDENGAEHNEGSGYAIQVDELIPLLNSNNVPYTLSTGSAASSSDPGSDAASDDESVPAEAEPQAASSDNTTIVIVIAAAVVVIVVIVAVVAVKGKKPAPAAPVQSMNSAAPVRVSNGAVITGMKGIMANRSFNINGSITLGRNTQKCNVCFPVDSKGISGVHCQIRQANGGYEIVDLGSSNGTFLGSGQKLTPNVPVSIPDGTYFYLGSAEQLFQIKY